MKSSLNEIYFGSESITVKLRVQNENIKNHLRVAIPSWICCLFPEKETSNWIWKFKSMYVETFWIQN